MNERLKELRKILDLSQEEFGNRLGVTKASISRLESGINNLTDRMIKSICLEFSVNSDWLISGDGEMFVQSECETSEAIDLILHGENNFARAVFKAFAKLGKEDWQMLENLMDSINNFAQETVSPDEMVNVLKVARSTDHHGAKIIKLSKADIERLNNAPDLESDDDI